jgi:HEAT repeat protein
LNDSETGPTTNQHYYVRSAAARALGRIGLKATNALPALRTLFQDQNPYVRVVSAIAIWRIDSDVTNTLPILIEGLNKVSSGSTWEVVEGIGEMGHRATNAVPTLIEYLTAKPSPADPMRSYNREQITNALMKIDTGALTVHGTN